MKTKGRNKGEAAQKEHQEWWNAEENIPNGVERRLLVVGPRKKFYIADNVDGFREMLNKT